MSTDHLFEIRGFSRRLRVLLTGRVDEVVAKSDPYIVRRNAYGCSVTIPSHGIGPWLVVEASEQPKPWRHRG